MDSAGNKCFIVNIIGGPGVGKSTIYSFTYAKMKTRGYSIEQVQEVAKKLVWAENFEELNNQYHVTMQQYRELNSVYGKVKFVITDGSLIHGIYYNRHNVANVSNREVTEAKIVELYSKFNNINILLTRGNFPYEQAGRIQNPIEARHVDEELLSILSQYDISYKAFESSEACVGAIIDYITEQAKN